jgi:hypothetical protein
MPFKSKAQRRKFAELLVKGEITPETFEEWNRETGGQELPERVDRSKKKKGKRTTSAKRKTARRTTAKRKTAKRKTARPKTVRRKARKR